MNCSIYPCLWFDGNAEEAAKFYCRTFGDATIRSHNSLVVTFEVSNQKFMCLNGGPMFTINPSVSFYTISETNEELKRVWSALLEGGKVRMPLESYPWSPLYGWIEDRFGVNWQLSLGSIKDTGQKFTPALMFTGNNAGKAEEAINLYTSIFDDSGIKFIARYEKNENDTEGHVKHAQFLLSKILFAAMDSSYMHGFTFNEAFSLVVECETQEEIDHFWEKLSEGGKEEQCGWLKDRFGFSWQIIPSVLEKLMNDPNKAQDTVDAFLKMKKFEIDRLPL